MFKTWLLDLVLYLTGRLTSPGASLLMQSQMLLPAFSAMLLGAFFFTESPPYFKTNRTASRWFVYFYLCLTLLYLGGAILGLLRPELVSTLPSLLLIPNLLGMVLLIVLHIRGGKDVFTSVGMGRGKWQVWLLYGLGVIAFHGLQTLLNVNNG